MGILLWPFRMIWVLICFLFNLMGRLLTIIIGLAFMVIGAALILTLVGTFVGIPLAILGLLLVVRSIF